MRNVDRIRRLRARIERLERELSKRVRVSELAMKFDNGTLTEEEDREALMLNPRWPAMKAALAA
jgi:hypothetical protein